MFSPVTVVEGWAVMVVDCRLSDEVVSASDALVSSASEAVVLADVELSEVVLSEAEFEDSEAVVSEVELSDVVLSEFEVA
jgi:uncharacterized protein YjbI with pentapeptide repeats